MVGFLGEEGVLNMLPDFSAQEDSRDAHDSGEHGWRREGEFAGAEDDADQNADTEGEKNLKDHRFFWWWFGLRHDFC